MKSHIAVRFRAYPTEEQARLAADRLHAMGLPVAIAYAEPEA